jgi:hypothetical protein
MSRCLKCCRAVCVCLIAGVAAESVPVRHDRDMPPHTEHHKNPLLVRHPVVAAISSVSGIMTSTFAMEGHTFAWSAPPWKDYDPPVT